MGSCYYRHLLPPGVFRGTLGLDGLLLCCPVFFGSGSFHPGAVGDQGPKLGRELLNSSLSVRFRLRGVGHLALRLNNAGVGYGSFPLSYCFLPFINCFLSLNHSFLAYIQLRFALRKLRFRG